MGKKKFDVPVALDKSVYAYFEAVAKIADVKPETVMRIALAQYLLNHVHPKEPADNNNG